MKLMYSDVLKEVQPSAILYSPSGTKVTRASILGELVPEIVTGLIWKVDSYVADCGMMQEPLHNRSFDKLRTVLSTEWDQPQYHGVLNFRALLVEKYLVVFKKNQKQFCYVVMRILKESYGRYE